MIVPDYQYAALNNAETLLQGFCLTCSKYSVTVQWPTNAQHYSMPLEDQTHNLSVRCLPLPNPDP